MAIHEVTCCMQQYHAEPGNILRAHHKVAIGNLVVFIMAEADIVLLALVDAST